MQLNEILEENSLKAISVKTNLAESNIEILLAGDFDKLKKVKTLGFISILEREYKSDLSALRNQALAYYEGREEDESAAMPVLMPDKRQNRSKWFIIVVVGIFLYATWYFFSQFDKKQLADLMPFSEDSLTEMILPEDNSGSLSLEDIKIEENTEEEVLVIDSESESDMNNTNEENSSIE